MNLSGEVLRRSGSNREVPGRRGGGGGNPPRSQRENPWSDKHPHGHILQRLAVGQHPRQIAFAMAMSPKRVSAYCVVIRKRLGVKNVESAVRKAIRLGFVRP